MGGVGGTTGAVVFGGQRCHVVTRQCDHGEGRGPVKEGVGVYIYRRVVEATDAGSVSVGSCAGGGVLKCDLCMTCVRRRGRADT